MPHCFSENMKTLEGRLGYSFKNKKLLLKALTHSSYKNENPHESEEDNERLEFLGDSVLGLAVAEALYKAQPELDESLMAKYKAYLVSRMSLSTIAKEIGLGGFLRLGRGELKTGGYEKEGILADAFEAVIGAIFLDSSYENARDTVYRLMGPVIEECIKEGYIYDYKSNLQELTQQKFNSLPEYIVVSEEGKDHDKVFTVEVIINGQTLGIGRGHSKKEAQMEAAREALKKLQQNNL